MPQSGESSLEGPDGQLALVQDAMLLAAAVKALGDSEWAEAAAGVAGVPAPPADATAPTFRTLALRGIAVVLALADTERWDESHEQARFLARHFRNQEAPVGTIAAEGLAGLVTSADERDREGMQDFAAFVLELYG